MRILLLESFYTSSHKQWADGLIHHSSHKIDLLSLPGRHWKWRMENAAVHFAKEIKNLNQKYDLILCTDLINLAVLRGLLSSYPSQNQWYNQVPLYLYFHENQITYPWSESDPDIILKRDNHYGWINYLSCLAADKIFFNSLYHKHNFFSSLPTFLGQFPDELPTSEIAEIKEKGFTLPIGLDIEELSNIDNNRNSTPVILWNHRWEYDKNPEAFFNVLFKLAEENIDFEVIIAGEKYKRYPKVFDTAKQVLKDRIIHFGYAKSRAEYISLLQKADIMPVTSNQDFFGISAVEGIAAGAYPLLPDRLAFSEHLQVANKTDFYYSSDEYLLKKLRKILSSGIPDTSLLRTHIMKYDWLNLIKKYDQNLSGS